jgi:hypothetical protein
MGKFLRNESILKILNKECKKNAKLEILISLLLNKTINSKNSKAILINSSLDLNHFLIEFAEIAKLANMNKHSAILCNAFYSAVYNLMSEKIKDSGDERKYLDMCIISDLSDCLLNSIGIQNRTNTVKLIIF